ETKLGEKGYTRSTSGKPDFLIGYHTIDHNRIIDSVHDYMDYRDRGGTDDPQDAYAFGYIERTLMLEVYDAPSQQLLWRASASAVVNDDPDERRSQHRDAAAATPLL